MGKRKAITLRTAERLKRAGYEYDHLAGKFRADGLENYAMALQAIGLRLHKLGDQLHDDLSGTA